MEQTTNKKNKQNSTKTKIKPMAKTAAKLIIKNNKTVKPFCCSPWFMNIFLFFIIILGAMFFVIFINKNNEIMTDFQNSYLGLQQQNSVLQAKLAELERNNEFDTAGIAILDMTDWQSYSNELFNFSFRYPGDWNIFTDTLPLKKAELANGFTNSSQTLYIGSTEPGETSAPSVSFYINPEKHQAIKSNEHWTIKKSANGWQIVARQKSSSANLMGEDYYVISADNANQPDADKYYLTFVLLNNNITSLPETVLASFKFM